MNISILIGTFGEDHWCELAEERAVPSARRQDAEVVVVHQPEGTVSSARNAAAEQASGEWLLFLDADDELDEDFLSAMRRAKRLTEDIAVRDLLLTPSVSYVHGGRREPSKMWREIPLEIGNWLVLGTMVPRGLFFEVGGFRDYGDPPGSNAFEDWALWSRCYLAGARIAKVPEAVYIAHWDRDSRHRRADLKTRLGWQYEIGRELFPEYYPEDWVSTASRPQRQRRQRSGRL